MFSLYAIWGREGKIYYALVESVTKKAPLKILFAIKKFKL
jgi:hypothetical protein